MERSRLFIMGLLLTISCAESGRTPAPSPPSTTAPEEIEETPPPQPKLSEQKRREISAALWRTSLGRMFRDYLFEVRPYEDFPPLSRQLVLKIYSDRGQVAARIGAISFLISDIYAHGMMTQDALARITILESDIYQQAEKQRLEIRKTAAHQSAVFFLAAIPLGSPLVRQQIGQVANNVGIAIRRVTRGEYRNFEKIEFERLITRDVWHDYKPSRALNAFISSFGPYAMLYFFYEEWMAPSIGREAGDISMIYGLDELMMAMAL